MTRAIRTLLATVGAALLAGLACSTPDPSARVVETVPDAASFPQVAQVFVHTCGTLDCHGTVARNLRIYGNTGLRYAVTDTPSALTQTTADEVTQDFDSVVGLEPEILSEVVSSGGAQPERLTFVRKARGTEHHKPGAIIAVGDDRDCCFTSWLAGSTDATACAAALKYP